LADLVETERGRFALHAVDGGVAVFGDYLGEHLGCGEGLGFLGGLALKIEGRKLGGLLAKIQYHGGGERRRGMEDEPVQFGRRLLLLWEET
jgi:hypothetical protein